MGSGKQQRWKISFHKNQTQTLTPTPTPTPLEFLCPISGSIMADPVIVSSGHTFERNCLRACVNLSFNPNGVVFSDLSTVIPNLALKSMILNWCTRHQIQPPQPLDLVSAQKIVVKLISDSPSARSDESITPLPLNTCSYSSSSSSCEVEVNSNQSFDSILNQHEEDLLIKLRSSHIHEQEEALIALRKLTRTKEETRVRLCSPRLLSSLKLIITSRYSSLQVNAVATLVNLSLEKQNKVRIVRSGIVPPLIDVLRGGFPESQDHAAGALFSLSLDDQNKTAIGVLGALPPLLHSLRSESERTRHDSSLALYHLSFVQSNRVKLIKLGAVQILLGMVRSGHMLTRVMLVLCNLAASAEGRAAMLDGGAVECFLGLLSREEMETTVKESCLAAVYGLSYGGLRFKGLAKEGGAEEVLRKLEENGSEQCKEKVRRIMGVLMEKHEEEEEVNWEELLSLDDDLSRTHSRVPGRIGSSSC